MNASGGTITIDDALMILEITQLDRITLDELPSIRARAVRRWHPDLIQHEKPSPERSARYHANFVQIEAALTLVGYLLSGQGARRTDDAKDSSRIDRAQVRRCQAELNRIWPDLRNRPGVSTQRTRVLSEGIALADALQQDLDDDLAGIAAFSFAAGVVIGLASAFLVLVTGAIMEIVGAGWIMGPVGLVWLGLWAAHVVACLLLLAPLSRLWLPEVLKQPVAWLVDRPIIWVNEMHISNGQALLDGMLRLFANLIRYLLVKPLYFIVIRSIGHRRVFKATLSENWFGGIPERHARFILETGVDQLSEAQCQDILSLHAWSRAHG